MGKEHSAILKWPETSKNLDVQTEVIEVGSNVDFVYIMRKDGKFTMRPIAQKLAGEYLIDEEEAKQILLEEYDIFFNKLADNFLLAFSGKGNIELHLYDPDILDKAERKKAGMLPIVSLDPLMNKGVHELKVSRGFYQGGKKDHGQVNRPGSKSLTFQAEQLAEELGKTPVCVVEDDIFSGGSVIKALEELLKAGIKIQKVIPGIQVGRPTKLESLGITVDPVVQYKTTDNTDIFAKVDLGDPRDFLLGASGLVIKLPQGQYGRAPYILPFVSTAARASIPEETEREFALKTLQGNFEFFKSAEERINQQILLRHMDDYFMKLMFEQYNFDNGTPMTQVVTWAMANLESLWKLNSNLGVIHEQIEVLGLPRKLVFIDVNGTLIPDDSLDGKIDKSSLLAFQDAVTKLNKQNLRVGLCSDSPLPQLLEFAKQIGLDGAPIIAENGNLIANNGIKITLNSLENLADLKFQITKVAQENGYQQSEDSIAPEFGGSPPSYKDGFWGFGANRETSITVFGPAGLIEKLGAVFAERANISIDCSPEYNYFAIHPGKYKENKGKTLGLLGQFGYNVIMVGNTMSDWVEPSSGVKCAFVGQAKIDEVTKKRAYLLSNKPTIKGVIEILSQLS